MLNNYPVSVIVQPKLDTLPNEILKIILSDLAVKELLSLFNTSRKMRKDLLFFSREWKIEKGLIAYNNLFQIIANTKTFLGSLRLRRILISIVGWSGPILGIASFFAGLVLCLLAGIGYIFGVFDFQTTTKFWLSGVSIFCGGPISLGLVFCSIRKSLFLTANDTNLKPEVVKILGLRQSNLLGYSFNSLSCCSKISVNLFLKRAKKLEEKLNGEILKFKNDLTSIKNDMQEIIFQQCCKINVNSEKRVGNKNSVELTSRLIEKYSAIFNNSMTIKDDMKYKENKIGNECLVKENEPLLKEDGIKKYNT